ncbi:MAG TPA: NAD(P)-binding domain-containing protein, partial [Propionibacteriaceae bacterium]|nr:NAD(P)-binding domain-containing protein [Propionibacteriaceae bacterium]
MLGDGLLVEPVVQRLLGALPPETHIWTYGRNADVLAQLQRLGAQVAASPADLAARSEYLLVLLETLDDLEVQLAGPSGLRAGMHSPKILVVSGISAPADLRELAGDLAESTARLVR